MVSHASSETRRLIPSLLIPFIEFALQWVFWEAIQPYVWFLFYPAVFLSPRIGGLRGGLAATGVSVVMVWWFLSWSVFPLNWRREDLILPEELII